MGNKHIPAVIFHAEHIGARIPIDLLDIAPGFIASRFNQCAAQLRSKTRLAAPDQLRPLLGPGQIHALDAIHHLIKRTDVVLGIVPGPKAKVGHEPDSFFRRGTCKNPDWVIGIRDVFYLVLYGKHELNVAPRHTISVCGQRTVDGAQDAQDFPPVVLSFSSRGDHM